jgi:hypothetical protein
MYVHKEVVGARYYADQWLHTWVSIGSVYSLSMPEKVHCKMSMFNINQKHLKYNLIYHRRLIKRITGHKNRRGTWRQDLTS